MNELTPQTHFVPAYTHSVFLTKGEVIGKDATSKFNTCVGLESRHQFFDSLECVKQVGA